jgi:tripartite-type tricarboxylate transporter receptor subunit TctC
VVLAWTCAAAQNYPVKPVRGITPFPPGAGVDIVTRLIAPKLAEALGQQFIVDNRAGAAGHIGAESAAHAAPDGYTLLLAPASIVISATLYKKLNYNLEKDLEPIAVAASAPFVLVVHPSLPAKHLKELIALAKAKPGALLYASTGNGGTPHLAMEVLKMQTGMNVVHVPYKGTPPALTDLIAGQVQMMFANTLSVLPQVRSGRLRALGISSAKRSAAAPELPTIAEAGVPGFEASTWFGLFAPTGTPQAIVQRLSTEMVRIVQQPETREKLLGQGADPIGMPASEFRGYFRSELVKWAKIVQTVGVKLE